MGFVGAGAIGVQGGSSLVVEDSVLTGNGRIGMDYLASGGAVQIGNSVATIAENIANFGGGFWRSTVGSP